ncbi:hypothetical protein ANCCAN_01702 [Ancylostoma caninum]|uniref:SCP-like protein n=1 Tax=Ancylostoma caninum TaxID=29170 RepID=A0A368H9G6_ANCCA|nr:hypothetical protein ANCCAN_01702 [Ancylostoma caninum]
MKTIPGKSLFGLLMLLILIFSLLGATLATLANCPGAALTNDERDALTNAHNMLRSQIATGAAPNWAGNLNAGKNIYMLRYDCALEEAAKNAMGGVCSQAIAHNSPYGHNVQAYV